MGRGLADADVSQVRTVINVEPGKEREALAELKRARPNPGQIWTIESKVKKGKITRLLVMSDGMIRFVPSPEGQAKQAKRAARKRWVRPALGLGSLGVIALAIILPTSNSSSNSSSGDHSGYPSISASKAFEDLVNYINPNEDSEASAMQATGDAGCVDVGGRFACEITDGAQSIYYTVSYTGDSVTSISKGRFDYLAPTGLN
jgi:hypothetical protein